MFQRISDSIKQLGLLGPLALFMVAGPLAGAFVLAATGPLWIDTFLGTHAGRIPLFVLATTLLAGLSLIPTHASSLVGGMAFGVWGGIVWAITGTAAAAVVGFLVFRRLAQVRAQNFLADRPKAEAIHSALASGHTFRGIALLALIRLSPTLPFAATNLLMSTTGMRVGPFLIGSILGMLPRVFAVVWIGSTLTELDLSKSGDRRLAILGVVATVAVLFLLGRIARRALVNLQSR